MRICLPRIRGGVSIVGVHWLTPVVSSPHTRGCFPDGKAALPGRGVFPAYAGVFLTLQIAKPEKFGLPRIRGGVSPVP